MSKSNQVRPIFLPAGVAAPDQHIGYVGISGAIEALDLHTGESLWRAEIDARPVLVFENLLVVLSPVKGKANALKLVEVDRNNEGEFVRESDELMFPDWVHATITPDLFFSYEVSRDGSDLVLEWEAHARYQGGASPSAQIQAQATQDTAGTARFNLQTGEVREFPGGHKQKIELPSRLLEANLFSYQRGASTFWHTEPWSFDGRFAVLVGEVVEDRQTLKLQTWDGTGEIAPANTLLTGQALVSYVTPDGLYLFVHSEILSDKPDWWIFSVTTGKELAVLKYEEVTREGCVLNSRVYYLVEDAASAPQRAGENLRSKMKAVEIASGKLIWERLLSLRPTRKPAALRQ